MQPVLKAANQRARVVVLLEPAMQSNRVSLFGQVELLAPVGKYHALKPGEALGVECASGSLFDQWPEAFGQVRPGILFRLAKRLA